MYICSRCCTPSDDDPVMTQTETLKNGKVFNTKFCERCTERINANPGWQFTCTDWSEEEKKYKSVSDWQKANLKLRRKK